MVEKSLSDRCASVSQSNGRPVEQLTLSLAAGSSNLLSLRLASMKSLLQMSIRCKLNSVSGIRVVLRTRLQTFQRQSTPTLNSRSGHFTAALSFFRPLAKASMSHTRLNSLLIDRKLLLRLDVLFKVDLYDRISDCAWKKANASQRREECAIHCSQPSYQTWTLNSTIQLDFDSARCTVST